MLADLAGFFGQFDRLVPQLVGDPIYAEGRLGKHSTPPKLGNFKSGDAKGDAQYMWWNSETQSNWWDGFIRFAIQLGEKEALHKAGVYVEQILATQDDDGYLGIYDRELRYNFQAENGELWAKATLLRGLLGWYEFSRDEKVLTAVIRAVENVMKHYTLNASQPFFAGKAFSGGVAHGLMFTDVLDRLSRLTGQTRFLEYGVFLYRNFSSNYSSEADVQLDNILDQEYKLTAHGVHTYEHFRSLIAAAYGSDDPVLWQALDIYGGRIQQCLTATGGPIGDEWIHGRIADAAHTGYEYCSIHELLDSYTMLLQKTGAAETADAVERIFFNAAQGARHPERSAIAYLKTDNSYEMLGTRNGDVEPHRKQTRYKYSPVHQDVAACCAPNAGRISAYFVRSMFMRNGDVLIAALLGPCELQTFVQGTRVIIRERTGYPYSLKVEFDVHPEQPLEMIFKVRRPLWATAVVASDRFEEHAGFLEFSRRFSPGDAIKISFEAEIILQRDLQGEHYFTYGPLVFALPIAGSEKTIRVYAPGMEDVMVMPDNRSLARLAEDPQPALTYENDAPVIQVSILDDSGELPRRVRLVPVGKTVLRQVTFSEKI